MRFLHYDIFQPLFFAIITKYLHSHSQLSLLFPLHWTMFTIGEGHVVVYFVGF
jgi:hypothetical protein